MLHLSERATQRVALISMALTLTVGFAPCYAQAASETPAQESLEQAGTSRTVYVAEVPVPQIVTGPAISAGATQFQAPLSPAFAVEKPVPPVDTAIAPAATPTTSPVENVTFQAPPVPALPAVNQAPVPGADKPAVAYAITPLIPMKDAPNAQGIIVIDMDLEQTQKSVKDTLIWKEIPDAPGKTCITSGVEFPIAVVSMLSSKNAKAGDRVEARTKVDLKIGGRLIAPKGSKVIGHVTAAHPARRLLLAELKLNKRWMRANGSLGLQFDEILTNQGDHLPLVAIPARHARIVNNKNEGRILGVNHEGQIASPLSIQLKHQGVHLAVRGAAAAGGVFTMGAVPVIFGIAGAIDPSFAFMHPVGRNVRHRRLKGFGMGVVSGLPGGFIVADYMIRGVEAQVKPGDEFLVAFKQDFTGEKATEAQLHGATTKVHGEVLNKKQKKSK